MNYYNLKAMLAATKGTFELASPTESFYIVSERHSSYIEPSFEKLAYDSERPSVLLISAVGVTGKTTLANVLSYDVGIPLLDLATHKPVADNTLTGVLHKAFHTQHYSDVFAGISKGEYGVIIDAIDEGRSKTTEKGFEAFLDDIAALCPNAPNTTFVVLGRPRIMEDCWLYLTDKGIRTGLLTIAPFDLTNARTYIDAFSEASQTPHKDLYENVRDNILDMLGAAFTGEPELRKKDFLSFIGYPPVLDSIVTLLREERNYHKLSVEMQSKGVDNEIRLLHQIAHYILQRERKEKVVPNIVEPLVSGLPRPQQIQAIENTYDYPEQAARLISLCLKRPITLQRLENASLNERYEEQLSTFVAEHPFLTGQGSFRNAVFESVALSVLMASSDPKFKELVLEYTRTHQNSYHLIYLLSIVADSGYVPIEYLHVLAGSAMEFWSRTASVDLKVIGPDFGDCVDNVTSDISVDIDIEIVMGGDDDTSKSFAFCSNLDRCSTVNLNSPLSTAYISLPCEVVFSATEDLQIVAPVEVSALRLHFEPKGMVLRQNSVQGVEGEVVFEAENVTSRLENIFTNEVPLRVHVADHADLAYPLYNYIREKRPLPEDRQMKEKYLRLRRILVEFRSHGRGALARHRQKIEDERVLRNQIGRNILDKLLKDGILTISNDRYFLQPEQVNNHLAVTWPELRSGVMPSKLLDYLRSID